MTGFLTTFEMTFYILERESVFEAASPPQKHFHFSYEMPVISSAARNLINKHVIGNVVRNPEVKKQRAENLQPAEIFMF